MTGSNGMDKRASCVIAGGGHAAGRAAGALRDGGFMESIYMIGDEPLLPYERPPLSKDVLSKSADPASAVIYPQDFYKKNKIELILGNAVSELNLNDRSVAVGKTRIPFSRLLICTGARARRLDASGNGVSDVLYLRTAADALVLRERLTPGSRIVLIGAGFIGLEVAASAAARGCSVTVLESAAQVLGRGISTKIANAIAAVHQRYGVVIRTSIKIHRIIRESGYLLVEASDGTLYAADAVVAGIGAEPNVELCAAAGLACADGILADEFGQTAAPNVFAAGDVVRRHSPRAGRNVRLESWENAEIQSAIVARNVMGARVSCDSIPWFWTDQYELNLQILGSRDEWDEVVVRGDVDDGEGIIFYLRKKIIVAAELLNRGRDRRAVKSLMEQGVPVDSKKIERYDIPIVQGKLTPTT